MVWHDIRDPNDPELDGLATEYKLHPLHIEDCRHRGQNAKVEPEGEYLFVVLKPMLMKAECDLEAGDFDIFIGKGWIITVRETGCEAVREAVDRIKGKQNGLRPDQILHKIMDEIVDSYSPILDRLNEIIDEVEDQALNSPSPKTLQRVFDVKRALIQFRRVLANMRDIAGHLQRAETPLIHRDMWPFLRDVYDHIARDLDMVETQRDLISGSLDIYFSAVADRTNRIMKVLTVVGAVATPALVITGFYGMNLKNLPGAESPATHSVVTWTVVGVTGLALFVLRLLHWI